MKTFDKFIQLNTKQHLSLVLSVTLVLLPIEIQALPSGTQVVSGDVTFDTTQTTMTITATNKAIINYSSFNIGSTELVNFVQPSASSVVLNRVVLANPSSILGTLNANGRVFLINPAGIYFGPNSTVNANSFLATTLNITDSDFLNDNYHFQQMQDMAASYIIQKGSITVSPEGFVILAAPFVSSEGVIMAKAGQITVGATDNFYIQFDADGLVKYDYSELQENSDDPIIVPKEYADTIIDNVINTEGLDEAVKIVQNGDTIELVGASGTALITSELNSDATESASAGNIDVLAQRQALILDGAEIYSDAADNGDGGRINIFGSELSYSGSGASYSATGGLESGDGGYLEISADDKVVLSGSSVSLSAPNGENGLFYIDPSDIEIEEDQISYGTDIVFEASNSIILNTGITISTRSIDGNDYLLDSSVGDSGSVLMSAPQISLLPESKILTFADEGYSSGSITLNATSLASDLGFEARSDISLDGAYLKGGDIAIIATAMSSSDFDSVNNDIDAIDYALEIFSDISTLPVAVSVAQATSSVSLSNTVVEGDNIDIQSNATADASSLSVFTGVAVGYGESIADAQTNIQSGTQIISSADVNIESNVNSTNSVSTYTVNLGEGRGAVADLTLSYAKTETNSQAVVDTTTSISAAGDVTVNAYTSKSISASASSGAYEDGTVGAAVAMTKSTSVTEAFLGGEIEANNLSVTSNIVNETINTAASAAVGTNGLLGYVLDSTNNLIDKATSYFSSVTPDTSSESGATKVALSAAYAYSDNSSQTSATIADNTVVSAQGDISVSAQNLYSTDWENGDKGVKTSATASIDNSDDIGDPDQQDYSVAGAVTLTNIQSSVSASIGSQSTLNSYGDTLVSAETLMPYEVTWDNIATASDITSYLNGNIGIQNGFFTTWAQSSSSGDIVGAAGAVNYFRMTNDTEAYIAENTKINQDINSYGSVNVNALTDIQTVNLSGVFGLLSAGAEGESGVGGAYLDVRYNDTTKADVKDGVQINAESFSLTSETKSKNISIAASGSSAEKYGASGSFSYLEINNLTQSNFSNAEVNLLGSDDTEDDLYLLAQDDAQIFNVTGGVVGSTNVGIGASVSINEISRDTQANMLASSFVNNGTTTIEAINSGKIDAYSLAGSTAVALGVELSNDSMAGQFGIGLSGDVSLNRITDTTIATIQDSQNEVDSQKGDLNLHSEDTTGINSFAGSVSIAVSNRLSVGLAGSYSQNDITTTTQSSIVNSQLQMKDITVDAINSASIDAYTASGSGSVSAGVAVSLAGSVSINNIDNKVTAEVVENSDLASDGSIAVNAEDSVSINGVAGSAVLGGAAGVGASLAANTRNSDIEAQVKDSTLSSASDLDILATESATIELYAASLAAATSGMAASITVIINTIINGISAIIDNGLITANGDVNVKAQESESITTAAGDITASTTAGFGASLLFNTIQDSIEAYIQDTSMSALGNLIVRARSEKSIDAKAAGGAISGEVSGQGSGVSNLIEDNTNAYIASSNVDTKGSIAVEASEINRVEAFSGVLSIGSTIGIGGSIVANVINNNVNAYIQSSSVRAAGSEGVSALQSDGTQTESTLHGIDVLAYTDESIETNVASLTGSGTTSLGASVAVNLIKDSTNSYIKESTLNEDNTNASLEQSVRVDAVNRSSVDSKVGGLAIGGVEGVGASSDTTMIHNSTSAYIKDSFIYAKDLLQTSSKSTEWVNSIVVSGTISGALSIAGSVAVVDVDNSTHASTLNSTLNSEGDLEISAKDTTYLGTQADGTQNGIIAGALSVGGASGVGGSVVVTNVKQDTLAHADDTRLNAKRTTSILADNYSDFIVYAATASVGAYLGAGGAVAINTADTKAKAYTKATTQESMLINQDDAYSSSVQDVKIQSSNYSSITSTLGTDSAGFTAIGGSVNVSTIHNTSLAEAGTYTKIDAQRDLSIKAISEKVVDSTVVAGSGGIASVAGAVTIANINTNIDADGSEATAIESDEDTDSPSTTQEAVNNEISKSFVGSYVVDADSDTLKTTLDTETESLNVNTAFDTDTALSEITHANLGDATTVSVGGITSIEALDTTRVVLESGSTSGGIVGAGGAVAIANIGSDTRASIGDNVGLESGSVLIESSLDASQNSVTSYAGALGGLVGLGAAVSKLSLDSTVTATTGSESEVITNEGDFHIEAKSDLSDNAVFAYGAQIGGAVLGVTYTTLEQNSQTLVTLGRSSTYNTANDFVALSTHDARDLRSVSEASSGGIASGSGAVSRLDATPVVSMDISEGVDILSSGDVALSASALGSLKSEAIGTNVGGITVGVSDAKAQWTPEISTIIEGGGSISADNIYIDTLENYVITDGVGYAQLDNTIEATASSSNGSFIGGSAATSDVLRDSTVTFIVYDNQNMQAQNDILLNTKSFGNTKASSNGRAYGVLVAGMTTATVSNTALTNAVVGDFVRLTAGSDIKMDTYARSEASSSAVGGQGGLLSASGTKTVTNVTNEVYSSIGSNGFMEAGDEIALNAYGHAYASSYVTIDADGAITENEVEADTTLNEQVAVSLGENTVLDANYIQMLARTGYLKALSEAKSTTFAVNSTSRAIANTDATSHTDVTVGSGAVLDGSYGVNIESSQDGDMLLTSAIADAKIDAGVTGELDAEVTNNAYITSDADIQSGSTILTKALEVVTDAPSQNADRYYVDAIAEANTVVNWVIERTEVVRDVLKKIPLIGWIVEQVTEVVETLVREVTHSETTATVDGTYTSGSTLAMNADIYQKTSVPQALDVAADGTISTVGDIDAYIDGDTVVVNDLINHDQGTISLVSSGDITGHSNIYLDNIYDDITINNYSDKNLQINNIDVVSDNAESPNFDASFKGSYTFVSDYYPDTQDHSININNYGSGDIIVAGRVDNYSGTSTIYNEYGDIVSQDAGLLLAGTMDIDAYRGAIGSLDRPVEIELQKDENVEPSITTNSFYDTYLGLGVNELRDQADISDGYTIDNITLENIFANGMIALDIHTATSSYNDLDNNLIIKTPVLSQYDIHTLQADKDINIIAQSGVSMVLDDGLIQSGVSDLSLDFTNTQDPYSYEARYIESQTDESLALGDIVQEGGLVNIVLADGSFGGTGSVNVVQSGMNIDINSYADGSLNTATIDTSAKEINGLYINGVAQTSNSDIAINDIGHSSADISLNNHGGSVNLGADIRAISGLATLTATNGIYNSNADALVEAQNIALETTESGSIGTQTSAMNVDGELTARSSEDVYIASAQTMLLDSIEAGGRVSLSSDASIVATQNTTPNITAQRVSLDAQGDINGAVDGFIRLAADEIAAASANGEIRLNNAQESIITTVGDISGVQAANDVEFVSDGGWIQESGADVSSLNSDVIITAAGDVDINSITAAQEVNIQADGHIQSQDGTTDITAQRVSLDAQGDINGAVDGFIRLAADEIAAASANGEIRLNNSQESIITTVGDISGVQAANDVEFVSSGSISQTSGDAITSQNTQVILRAGGDIDFDYIVAPQRVTLYSNGAISQDGDSLADIVSNELSLHANSGIGSNNALDTEVNILEAQNSTSNDIAIANSNALTLADLDGDGLALYNGGGVIRIYSDGALTQAVPTSIFALGNIELEAQNDIFVSDITTLSSLMIESLSGDILGTSQYTPNLSAEDQIALYAVNGVIGTPANPISLVRTNAGVVIEAGEAENFLSTYIFGAEAPVNNFLDDGLTAFNNRIVNGTLIEQYYGMEADYKNIKNSVRNVVQTVANRENDAYDPNQIIEIEE